MDFINMFSLKGKNALVTGASYGIGFEIAKALSNAGATIIFNDVIEENIKKGLAAYKENNINAHGYLFDITDEQSCRSWHQAELTSTTLQSGLTAELTALAWADYLPKVPQRKLRQTQKSCVIL